MAKFDIESLLAEIETFMKDNLNTKLLAIDAEKNDGIVLKPVDSTAYFFQTLNEKVVNLNPFIFYGVDDIDTVSDGPGTLEDITIGVILVLADDAEDDTVARRMLRYNRALKELFADNFDKTTNKVKLSVKAYPPTQFTSEVNSSKPSRAAAITLTGRIPG